MNLFRLSLVFFLSLHIFGCVEKTTYYGKIITEKDLLNLKIFNKEQLLYKFGQPSFFDTIQNKFFYYTEKKITKNFYNEKTEYSYLFIFDFDKDGNIIKRQSVNLLDKNLKYNNFETENNIIKRGLIEKVFGGVGPNQIPNSP